MEKLQWFKFSPSDYMMGKIQRCPEITQARFIRLCCLYWNKECNLNITDTIIEIDQEHFDILISKKIITSNEEHIFIDFLDEQMISITETSKDKSKAAKIRWAKYNEEKNNADAMHVHTDAMQNDAEKRREEERRINIPTAFNFRSALLSFGFNSDLVDEWLRVRKNKKLTNTETAFKKFIKQVEINGNNKNEILEKCIEKSWGGFEADWYKKETNEGKIFDPLVEAMKLELQRSNSRNQ
jgi:hypothetical protein